MALIEQEYQHWAGAHEGVWYRRRIVAEGALRSCLQDKWLRRVLAGSWMSCLGMVTLLFIFNQLVDSTSAVAEYIGADNPQLLAIIQLMETWLKDRPDLTVGASWNLFFGFYTLALFWPVMIVLAMATPKLIARDLSSHALIIYQSRAVNRWDYLWGKMAAVLSLLGLLWLGPVLMAWLMGNLLAPSWSFFWYSREALGHALLFVALSVIFLSVLALGVSAISRHPSATVAAWLCLWLLGWGLDRATKFSSRQWLRNLSVRYDLAQVHSAVFKPLDTLDRIRGLGKDKDSGISLAEGMWFFAWFQETDLGLARRRADRRLRERMHEIRPPDRGKAPPEMISPTNLPPRSRPPPDERIVPAPEPEQAPEPAPDPEIIRERGPPENTKGVGSADNFRAQYEQAVMEETRKLPRERSRRVAGAFVALGAMSLVSFWLIYVRLRPE